MRLARLIANLGYGSQREVKRLIADGRVTARDGQTLTASSVVPHEDLLLDGAPLDPPAGLVMMLNKPVGFTCSTADPGRVVYELLPERFAYRSPIVAPVGRLDRETEGLLLLTDDGAYLHRIISPKSLIPKVYEADLAEPLKGGEAERLAAGSLMLKGEATPLAPAELEVLGPKRVRLTITEGRYHQVRRMVAALGNHVEALKRVSIGALALDGLEPGQWRYLDEAEKALPLMGRL